MYVSVDVYWAIQANGLSLKFKSTVNCTRGYWYGVHLKSRDEFPDDTPRAKRISNKRKVVHPPVHLSLKNTSFSHSYVNPEPIIFDTIDTKTGLPSYVVRIGIVPNVFDKCFKIEISNCILQVQPSLSLLKIPTLSNVIVAPSMVMNLCNIDLVIEYVMYKPHIM
jgi:hypothetical protein